jgi:FkbM family methyltransferase
MSVNIKKPIAFMLSSTNHGSMIINKNDYFKSEQGGFGVGYQILNTSSFDQDEINLVLTILQKRNKYFNNGVVAIDCGSNIGVHTVEWARLMTGWGKVYSFEAQEKLFYALAGNIAINNCFNVTAKNFAIGSKNGNINIPQPNYLEPGSYGSLEIRKKTNNEFIGQEIDYDNTINVEMISLDSLNLDRVDFIKIDVEGMEEEVLDGSVNTIKSHKPVLLIEHIKSNKNKIIDYLVSKNYRLTELGINILAVHNEDPLTKDISTSGNTFKIL